MVAILPDHGFNQVQKMIAEEPGLMYIPVSNEGIGVGICASAYLGGTTPAMIIPTSGLLVAVWPSPHWTWLLSKQGPQTLCPIAAGGRALVLSAIPWDRLYSRLQAKYVLNY